MLIEDFGNGSFFSSDRQNAAIVDSTYQIRFPKGQKVSNTGAAAVLSIPKKQQYTMEYLIKYEDNFEAGLHGKQFGFNLGVGYSGGAGETCRVNGNGGSIRLQFDAHEDYISNQLYAYYSDMDAETYGENPGNQKFDMFRGVWNKIRLTVTMESSYEAQDARIEVWLNDEKKIDVTGLSLVRIDEHRNISGVCFESFPGGGGEYPSYDNYLYIDDFTWYPGTENDAFIQAPNELYMKGNALAESSAPMKMQRIIKGFPESYNSNLAVGNTFELITALKTGEYSFSLSESSEDIILPANITIENSDEDQLIPYRIQVNYDNENPEVRINRITEVFLFAPWNSYKIATLDYTGKSTFEVEEIQYNKAAWGDERYRIKLTFDDESQVTYGYISGSISAPNNDSNTTGYFELYPTTNQNGWTEEINGVSYTSSEFKLSPKRRGEGYEPAPFDMKVIFHPVGCYYHMIKDFGVPTFEEAPESLFMRGTALAESSNPVRMKRIYKDFPDSYNGDLIMSNTYELITALKTGTFEFAIEADGEPIILSQSITVENQEGKELIPYKIRVNFDSEVPSVNVSKVDRVIMWAPSKKYTIATFDYTGNSTFKKEKIEFVREDWGDERYRIRIYTEDGNLITYGYIKGNRTAPDDDNNNDGDFDMYTTTNIDGWSEGSYTGTEFKLSRKRRGENAPLEPFNVDIIFSADETYHHALSDYEPNATNITSPELVKAEIYPTLIDNTVTIRSEEEPFSVEFISMTGLCMLKAESNGKTLTLDNINIAKGMYLVQITKAEKVLAVQRVIKL